MSSSRIYHNISKIPITSTFVLAAANYEAYRIHQGIHPFVTPRLEAAGIVARKQQIAAATTNLGDEVKADAAKATNQSEALIKWMHVNSVPIPTLQKLSKVLSENGRNKRHEGALVYRSYPGLRTLHIERPGVGITSVGNRALKRIFVPSHEQNLIVQSSVTENVVISARPGAGKTATAEAIVAAHPARRVAILTYSKRLQLETHRRLIQYNNADVFTFHGVARLLFNRVVRDDQMLRALRRKGCVSKWSSTIYDTIILDEFQDCSDDIFWLACAIIKAVTRANNGACPRIVVLGDERQAIFEFRGADARYLSLASTILAPLSPYPWSTRKLSTSFRLSHANAGFVNKVFLGGENYITGSHKGPKPLYLHVNPFDFKGIIRDVLPLIHKYGPENTAILAPYVTPNKRISLLTNYLTENHGILVAEPMSDDAPLDDDVLRGKICVSTYHQFKGMERDLVIVYGVDNGYFTYIAKSLPDNVCPNTTFVALTRARQQLVVVHDFEELLMPFINKADLYETTNFVESEELAVEPKLGNPGRPGKLGLSLPKSVSAADLPRYVLSEVIEEGCKRHLEIEHVPVPDYRARRIDAPSIILTDFEKQHYEAVSDLNGLAVVAAYEYTLLGTLTTLGKSKASIRKSLPLSSPSEQAIWLCKEACAYEARFSGYKSRMLQMTKHPFDWLVSYLEAAKGRIQEQFDGNVNLDFEVDLSDPKFQVHDVVKEDELKTIKLTGRADIIQYPTASTNGTQPAKLTKASAKLSKMERVLDHIRTGEVTIWEIKFVAKLSLQHVIQACVYAYLWSRKHERKQSPRIVLFNVRDGEKWEITPREGTSSLRHLIEEIMVAKYTSSQELTTEAFLKRCMTTMQEVECSQQKQDDAKSKQKDGQA